MSDGFQAAKFCVAAAEPELFRSVCKKESSYINELDAGIDIDKPLFT